MTRSTLAALTCASLLAACAGAGSPPPVLPPPTDRVPARSPDGGGPRLGALEPGDAPAGPTPGVADPAGGATRYTVRPGDSLVAIARRLTGDADDWRALARANAIVDPAALVPGTELVVPATLRGGVGDVTGRATDGTRDGAGADAAAGAAAGAAPSIDLLGALERAQRFDATFLLERERFAASRAVVTIARSGLLPQANLSAEAARNTDFGGGSGPGPSGGQGGGQGSGQGSGQDSGGAGLGAGLGTGAGGTGSTGAFIAGDYTQTTLSATLDQVLFDRPTRLALARARIDSDVAATRLVAAYEDLVVRVARAYFAVLLSGAELEFRSSDLDAIRRQLRRAEREYAVGTVSITDVVEARARRDLAEARLIEAEDARADARQALVAIVGLDGAGEPLVGEPAAGDGAFELAPLDAGLDPSPPVPADAEAWVALALENNATLIAARGALSAADTLVDARRAERLPTLVFGASAVAIDSDGPIPATETGILSLTGTLPVLSGGRVTGRIALASSDARAAGQRLADARRTTVRGARDAYREVLSSVARVRAFEQALESTRRAAEATEAGFRAGIRTSVQVLESLRDRFAAEADLAGARYDYLVGSLELARIAGSLEASDVRAVNDRLASSGQVR